VIGKILFVFPAKAGTHLNGTPEFSSISNALPISRGSCCRPMGPGLRRGDERMNARRISLTPSFAGVTEFGGDGIGPPSTNESYVWI
jgi:hypothetical protein